LGTKSNQLDQFLIDLVYVWFHFRNTQNQFLKLIHATKLFGST